MAASIIAGEWKARDTPCRSRKRSDGSSMALLLRLPTVASAIGAQPSMLPPPASSNDSRQLSLLALATSTGGEGPADGDKAAAATSSTRRRGPANVKESGPLTAATDTRPAPCVATAANVLLCKEKGRQGRVVFQSALSAVVLVVTFRGAVQLTVPSVHMSRNQAQKKHWNTIVHGQARSQPHSEQSKHLISKMPSPPQ